MSTHVPQNFYRQTVSQDWPIGTGNFYVSVKPTVSSGYMTISPASTTLREIVFFSATGTDSTGDYVTISSGGRGKGGTTEQTHIIGEPVRMNVAAETIQEIVDDIAAIVAAGAVDASTIAKGIVKMSVAPVLSTSPIAVGQNDPILAPASYSDYHISATEGMISFASDVIGAHCQTTGGGTIINFQGVGLAIQKRIFTADWAAADRCLSAVLLGAYFYAVLIDDGTSTARIYRYDKTNLAAGATLMTTSGQSIGTTAGDWVLMIDDSGVFYMTNQAGASASRHIISKYTLSGTVLTFVSNTTCGSTSSNFERFIRVDGSGNLYGWNYSVDNVPRKYNSSGVLQTTYITITGDVNSCIAGIVYVRHTGTSNDAGNVYCRINL